MTDPCRDVVDWMSYLYSTNGAVDRIPKYRIESIPHFVSTCARRMEQLDEWSGG